MLPTDALNVITNLVNGLEFGATVLRPGRFVGTHGGRFLFAVRDDGELLGADAQGNQVPFRPGSTWIQLVRPDANIVID